MPGMKYKEPSVSDYKPNCYTCRWRRDIQWSAHSRCIHPETNNCYPGTLRLNASTTQRPESYFIKAGIVTRTHGDAAALRLDVLGRAQGVEGKWFDWPWNFDPVWLEACSGWEHFTKACLECPQSLRCISGALETRPHDHCSAKTWEWRWKKNEESKLG